MKKVLNFLMVIIFTVSLISCIYNKKNFINNKVSNDAGNIPDEKELLFQRNQLNIKNNYPFYIIRLQTPLLLYKPDANLNIPDSYIMLKYGDVVFPVENINPVNKFFYVRTVNNDFGWINNDSGISINYNESEELYFFDDKHYLKNYIDAKGTVNNSDLVVLAKNIVPLLLKNCQSDGWFYPADYNLAYQIAELTTKLAEKKDTPFHSAAILFDWSVNEYLVAYNLLADCCHKLGMLNKAELIHLDLVKKHFWKRYDNSKVGGLNSIIKLELIYIDYLKKIKKGSKEYDKIIKKMVDNILIIGNNDNNVWTIIDKEWHLTGAEWALEILRSSVSRDNFYFILKLLNEQTASEGFKEMINLYTVLEMYNEGKQDEALNLLSAIKPKENIKVTLKLSDWLKENKIVPESIIYQYKF